jgi:23S rRNA (uracil1939-C5)-methyltransferase
MALAYPAQLRYKRRRVAAQLQGQTQLAGVSLDACVPSPATLGYRNQAKYVYGYSPDAGGPVLGAFAPRSHRIADLAGCRVVVPCLDQVREALLALLRAKAVEPFDERRRTGLLRYVVMHATRAGRVLVTLVAARSDWPGASEVAAALAAACPAVAGVVLNVNPSTGNRILGGDEHLLWGAAAVDDAVGEVAVRLSSRSFFQANREVAALLQQAVVAAVTAPVARAIDVYAGAAPFALALTALADEVVAIEENAAATATAAAAIAERGGRSHRVRLVTGDAAVALAAIPSAEVIVVDPPRKGCASEVLAAIVRLRPKLVAYVSCEPASLARDLAVLVAAGARVARITPFDMMPHTPHVETVALLSFG